MKLYDQAQLHLTLKYLLSSVDGHWTDWNNWTPACTKTCGWGKKYRYRTCTNPAPFEGGAFCGAEDEDTEESGSKWCNNPKCPGKKRMNLVHHFMSNHHQSFIWCLTSSSSFFISSLQ